MLAGTLAAAATPLRDGGAALDERAIEPYVGFLADGGLDGAFVLGTTGEGILLEPDERRRAAERFLAAAAGRLQVAVHCGAQTTAATAELAAHAAAAGADAVAVIPPPYFALDDDALAGHLLAAALACAPVPFYVYEFAARSGYAVAPVVIERLREQAPNMAGLKVSDAPWERFEPYLVEGLDVFVGPEALIVRALERGACGAVSGLAAAFPAEVARLVAEPSADRQREVEALRGALERFPFQAAVKAVLALRGVPVGPDVRAPLRPLTGTERAELARWYEGGRAA
ncbi:MAG: dihydrodipicolinate synthase family protein [Thermoleophilia bacterium]|nr:dihydrodipicolinate synthase family protein [Thermoleophilia bacterium]